MNIIKIIPSILLPLFLMTGCGDDVIPGDTASDSSGIDVKNQPTEGNTTKPKDQNNTVLIVDNNATFDLKSYFPLSVQSINCQLATLNLNLNTSIDYNGSDTNMSVSSDYDGLDLYEYTVKAHYMAMNTNSEQRTTSMWSDDTFVYLKRENNETNLMPRYFEDDALLVLDMDFAYVADFNLTTGNGQDNYSEAYVNDSLYCKSKDLGDYNISSTLYSGALEINCNANHSKGGTLNGVDTIVYNYDYNSSIVLLPQTGIVNVTYISRDMNFSVECQP